MKPYNSSQILILIIVFFTIFVKPDLSYADVLLNKCGSVHGDGEVEKLPDDRRHEYYISFSEGKVYYTYVASRETNEFLNEKREEIGENAQSRTYNEIYIITFADEKILTAEYIDTDDKYGTYLKKEIEIDFKTNRVSKYFYGLNDIGRKIADAFRKPYESLDGRSFALNQCVVDEFNNDGDSSGSSGTAFFINERGYLLTNHHVIEGCNQSNITYKNKNYKTKIIAKDKTLDLALLKTEIKPKSYFAFAKDETRKLNKIYVAGYPLGKGLSDDLKITSGIVSSLKGFDDNSNEIQIDAPINPGNSGGPIINENGDLVAIAVSGLAKDQTEGINFGIKASAAERFLKSNKLKANKSFFSSSKNNDQLLKILEEATVYTYCD